MGIKGLKQFLRNKFESCIQPSHLSQHNGKKMAMDLLPYLYRYKVTFGEMWRHGLFHLFTTFITYNVHLTVIMDGPQVYKEKEKERDKRKAGRNRIQLKINTIVSDLELYERTGEASHLLLSICKSKHKNLLGIESTTVISIPIINKEIKKLRQQIVSITTEDITVIEELCVSLSIPFYMARQEAESFASYLCNTNQVDMVVTEDTDVLAYGCHHWLSNIAHDGSCLYVSYNHVLEQMNLTMPQFIDFCILCGTDYNETLKGIGPISAYKNIQEYNTIQGLFEAKPQLKEDHFDYILVRTFFTNPCKEAIYNKENQDIKKISITFNPLPTEYNITKIKERYPITKFSKWLSSYSNWFLLE